MKMQELRGLSTKEILEKLKEEKQQLTKLKFNHAVSPIETPHKLSASRKLIARYLTELNARKNEGKAN